MECLKKIDELGIYNYPVAKPCILLDRYSSRFSLDFLEYASDNNTHYFILISVPCGIAKWQVSNSCH